MQPAVHVTLMQGCAGEGISRSATGEAVTFLYAKALASVHPGLWCAALFEFVPHASGTIVMATFGLERHYTRARARPEVRRAPVAGWGGGTQSAGMRRLRPASNRSEANRLGCLACDCFAT